MKTTDIDVSSVPVQFARFGKIGSVPAWAKQWNASSTTVHDLCEAKIAEGVFVVHLETLKPEQPEVRKLADCFSEAAGPIHMVCQVKRPAKSHPELLTRWLKLFSGSVSEVDFAFGSDRLEDSLVEATAKYLAHVQKQSENAPDPLAEAKEVIKATKPLLARSGRLSAPAVARAFGLSTAKLGELIGKSRQTLAKTPDAPAIQNDLRPFERVARLRSVLKDEQFRVWLYRPNRQLDQAAPIDLITDKRIDIVADLADDMLLGTPS
jgi:Protein of unknown function (DUF2384)